MTHRVKTLGTTERPERVRSRRYLNYVATFPCLVCRQEGADPHHLQFPQPKGTIKTGDQWAVPVCRKHHDEIHQGGIRETTFWALRGIDPTLWAIYHWDKFNGRLLR